MVKHLPAMQEMQEIRVPSLGGEDAPGKGRSPWKRKWLPTPVSLPEKLQGQRSLAGYSPWGHKSRLSDCTHTGSISTKCVWK